MSGEMPWQPGCEDTWLLVPWSESSMPDSVVFTGERAGHTPCTQRHGGDSRAGPWPPCVPTAARQDMNFHWAEGDPAQHAKSQRCYLGFPRVLGQHGASFRLPNAKLLTQGHIFYISDLCQGRVDLAGPGWSLRAVSRRHTTHPISQAQSPWPCHQDPVYFRSVPVCDPGPSVPAAGQVQSD